MQRELKKNFKEKIRFYSIIGKHKIHRSPMQAEIFQPSGQCKMPETRFPALSVYPRVGIFLSSSETDERFYISLLEKGNKHVNYSYLP